MRLLNVKSLKFAEFSEDDRPPYVAASHRWLKDGEASFQDVKECRNTSGGGYQKVKAFAGYIKSNISHIEWLWIDTCCINKDSAAELSEAINSMFDWYRGAELCLAYLIDVRTGDGSSSFEKSEWFKRGWTLQELLASRTVVFVTKEWKVIGHKGCAVYSGYLHFSGPNLGKTISRITRVPEQILHDYAKSSGLDDYDKMKWMIGRKTTKPEDWSYALYGILGVTLGANYGEKHKGASERLLAAIHQRQVLATQQARDYTEIVDWLLPPDPWTNHNSARQRHKPQTGTWLLHHNQYLTWKLGSSKFLWLYGTAGSGKTILCSTVIEDVQKHCSDASNAGQAIFYFSFSDSRKQTHENLILSLVVQLSRKKPSLSMLRQAYDKPKRKLPGPDVLQDILLLTIASYDEVYLHLDALDECPESGGARHDVLSGIHRLLEEAPNVRILVTSRDMPDIRYSMENSSADLMPIIERTTDADIQKYILTEISCDHKLSRLDSSTKTLVVETLSQRSGGMFRWVYCQLQVLKQSNSTKPKSVKATLLSAPRSLDETYERMLNNIDEDDRPYALTFLRWLAYAQSPPSLGELNEASIVDPTDDKNADGVVDVENRGHWKDALEILAGLVVVAEAEGGAINDDNAEPYPQIESKGELPLTHVRRRIDKDSKVNLAHFSVKEYLESPRILASDAREFHLDPAKEHKFLADSCLVYLSHYSVSSRKTLTTQDLAVFPLLEYAAKTWPYHASLQQYGSSTREVTLLTSEARKRDWLCVHNPDHPWSTPFQTVHENVGSALYYASLLGLETALGGLLSVRADINAVEGHFGNALQAASYKGHKKVVQMLIDAGADVNAQGGVHGNALYAASAGGHEKVVQMLVDAGADVNAQGGVCSNTLYAASAGGHEKVVQNPRV